jgi:hypothetical protein
VVSGWLYAWLGGQAFLAMSLLCLAALPVAFSLITAPDRTPEEDAVS